MSSEQSMVALSSPLASPLVTARVMDDPTEEEEARLDADPLHRLYDSHRIEAPAQLASVMGALTKLLMLAEREDHAEAAQEYFEHLKLARAADPRIDFDRFISTQLKILEKKQAPSAYDFNLAFEAPSGLAEMLTAFSREVIRYQPQGDNALFSFALEYFTCLVDDGTADTFLHKQARLAAEKQKAVDLETKRTAINKSKHKQKSSIG